MARIILKKGEAKTLRFTVKDSAGAPLSMSTATLSFQVKASKAGVAIISKLDADFDKSQAASGVVTLPLAEANLTQAPGNYWAELKVVFSAADIDKSEDILFVIQEPVHS
jgi:hypothetical protein